MEAGAKAFDQQIEKSRQLYEEYQKVDFFEQDSAEVQAAEGGDRDPNPEEPGVVADPESPDVDQPDPGPEPAEAAADQREPAEPTAAAAASHRGAQGLQPAGTVRADQPDHPNAAGDLAEGRAHSEEPVAHRQGLSLFPGDQRDHGGEADESARGE